MSVIIPVIIAILFYHNRFNAVKGIGIGMALVAVWLTSLTPSAATASGKSKGNRGLFLFLLPVIVFLGSGVADAVVNYAQERLVHKEETSLFVAAFFAVAGTIGVTWVTIRLLVFRESIAWRNVLGGILLGIPNYFSIYFMIKALNTHIFESAVIYPVNNMGIVLLSAMGGYFLLKEKLSPWNLAGIGLSILSIALIAFS